MKRNNVQFNIRCRKLFNENNILHFDQKNNNRKEFRRNIDSKNH